MKTNNALGFTTKNNSVVSNFFKMSLLSLSFISLILFSGQTANAQQQTVVLTTGTSWTVPAGAATSSITVECWGAGGGGSFSSSSDGAGGAGGGGAYAKKVFTNFTVGQSIDFVIGTGGLGATGTNDGGETWFSINSIAGVKADGGKGALNNSKNGALGGTAAASFGDIKFNGGKGGNGSFTSGWACGNEQASGGGGAAATTTAAGAAGGNAATNTGTAFCSGNYSNIGMGASSLLFTGYTSKGGNGVTYSGVGNFGTYGAGGSGGVSNTYNGGNGGNGLIRITYNEFCNTTATFTAAACESYTWVDGDGATYSSSTVTPTHIIPNTAGCDSIITLDLTITNLSTGVDTQTACESFTWINGVEYTANNNSATHILTGAASSGCDSIVTLNFSLVVIDATVTQTGGIYLSANESGATYEWIDCDNGNAPIAGETNQTFTATSNGNYAVNVTVNGCYVTSACTAVGSVGLKELNDISGISVFPNPTNDNVTIQLENIQDGQQTLELLDATGRILSTQLLNGTSTNLSLTNYENGMYIIRISNGAKQSIHRVIKK